MIAPVRYGQDQDPLFFAMPINVLLYNILCFTIVCSCPKFDVFPVFYWSVFVAGLFHQRVKTREEYVFLVCLQFNACRPFNSVRHLKHHLATQESYQVSPNYLELCTANRCSKDDEIFG